MDYLKGMWIAVSLVCVGSNCAMAGEGWKEDFSDPAWTKRWKVHQGCVMKEGILTVRGGMAVRDGFLASANGNYEIAFDIRLHEDPLPNWFAGICIDGLSINLVDTGVWYRYTEWFSETKKVAVKMTGGVAVVVGGVRNHLSWARYRVTKIGDQLQIYRGDTMIGKFTILNEIYPRDGQFIIEQYRASFDIDNITFRYLNENPEQKIIPKNDDF